MQKTGLIGKKLGHSLSPQIHERFYRITGIPGSYRLLETPESGLGTLLAALEGEGYAGVNVTIPYKVCVMRCLDAVSGEAAAIGAVNTVRFKDGKRTGYNTDYFGLKMLLDYHGITLVGRRVAILGTGGAARCAHRLAQDLEAAQIITVSRSPGAADKIFGAAGYEALDALERIDVLINTTPSGMYPDIKSCPVNDSVIQKSGSVVDIVYNPAQTQLLQKAAALGKPRANGLLMLCAQAVKAQEIWNGQVYGEDVYRAVFSYMEHVATKNLVLIGMPGSGKTTVGQRLAQRLHAGFVDTDALVEARHGPISNLFSSQGEAVFRQYEHEAALQAAQLFRTVIATGGGIVLDENNMRALKKTGIVVFLDRPLQKLMEDTDISTRPLLAGGKEALAALYEQRHKLYQQYADLTPDNSADIGTCVTDIINKLEEYP